MWLWLLGFCWLVSGGFGLGGFDWFFIISAGGDSCITRLLIGVCCFLLFVGVVCFCYLVFVRCCLGDLFGVLFCWVVCLVWVCYLMCRLLFDCGLFCLCLIVLFWGLVFWVFVDCYCGVWWLL